MMIGLVLLFTQKVLLRRNPIVSYYQVDHGLLRFHVTNTSDDDYRDLDFKVKPDYPDDFVFDGKELSNVAGLTVLDLLLVE